MRVPVDPYIPNPLRCFNCQKYGHSSRACKNPAACVKCGKAGHERASCSNQEQCANCKGKHAASSRECPKWKLEKQVQQIKMERGISFPDARKAALSEQSTNTSSKRTVASVVSGATTVSSQRSQKSKVSVAIQTELTWPQGADTPVPVKRNSQTTQTDSNENSAKKHRNSTSPSPPPRSNRGANAPLQYHLPVKAVRGTLNPHRPSHLLKRTANQR